MRPRWAGTGLPQPHHEYWSADIDLRSLSASQRARLFGPNQVADMQLLMLAQHHRGRLVTLDTGLRALASGTQYEDRLLIL